MCFLCCIFIPTILCVLKVSVIKSQHTSDSRVSPHRAEATSWPSPVKFSTTNNELPPSSGRIFDSPTSTPHLNYSSPTYSPHSQQSGYQPTRETLLTKPTPLSPPLTPLTPLTPFPVPSALNSLDLHQQPPQSSVSGLLPPASSLSYPQGWPSPGGSFRQDEYQQLPQVPTVIFFFLICRFDDFSIFKLFFNLQFPMVLNFIQIFFKFFKFFF